MSDVVRPRQVLVKRLFIICDTQYVQTISFKQLACGVRPPAMLIHHASIRTCTRGGDGAGD